MPRVIRFLALLSAIGCLAAPAALASNTQQAIFEDDNLLRANPSGILGELRRLGVDRIRVNLSWRTIAPNRRPRRFQPGDPAAYPARNWAPYDRLISEATTDRIGVFITVGGPVPLWVTGPGAPRNSPWPGSWKPSPSAFKSFVEAVGTRYSGRYKPRAQRTTLPRVSFWSIWNEPNYGVDLAPQAIDHDTVEVGAASYRGLLDAAWAGLHATGHGADTILIGETAPRGLNHPIGNFSGVKPLRFLRALYCVDASYRELRGQDAAARGCPTTPAASAQFAGRHPALFQASGFADHPYAQGVPPAVATYACGITVCWDPAHPRSDLDYADLPEVPRLADTLDRLNRIYGSHTRFPILSTEYGYWTRPPDKGARISPATAAYYLNWAEYLSYRQPRLHSYDQYLLVDNRRGNFASGLEFPDYRHKPTYAAYRLALFLPVISGRSLEVWGGVRAAKYGLALSHRPQTARIEFRRRGRFRTLQTVTITDPEGYFDIRVSFKSSGSVRLAYTYPSGATIYSRTVAITVS